MVQFSSKRQGQTKLHLVCDPFAKRQVPRLPLPESRLLSMGLSPATAQVVSAKLFHISETQQKRLAAEAFVLSQCSAPNLPVLLAKTKPRSRKTTHSKLAVFDLDETLVRAGVEVETADLVVHLEGRSLGVKVRPYARECLCEVSSYFEVAVFTASQAEYADQVLDFLDPEKKYIQHRLYRGSCLEVGPLLLKDLRVLPYGLKNVVMVDNSLFGYPFQRANGVPVNTWTGAAEDEELKTVPPYLRLLQTLSDVRPFNQSVFSVLY